MSRKRKKGKRPSRFRRAIGCGGIVLFILLAIHATIATWFVHHPKAWLDEAAQSWPSPIVASLFYVGNPIGDMTDALDWTGHDAVYTYDTEAPSGSVAFAGLPVRTGAPAPTDIMVLDKGAFKIGWSPSLRHPAWVAYHVPAAPCCANDGTRPKFMADAHAPNSPLAGAYRKSGYDRGHMAPNHAILTRFGREAQKTTFLMSNIAPQTPALNRGVWRDVEHRIAELWTARYGEIWVIVGSIPSAAHTAIHNAHVDIPDAFYQIVVAQEGLDIRAFAVLFPQGVSYRAYATRHLITIDELETLTGLDFLSELPEFIQSPLEAELPTRLWPIRVQDIFTFLNLGFAY